MTNVRQRSDTERLDFLQAQRNVTKWVGYDLPGGGYCSWPVFGFNNIRNEIDAAMDTVTGISHDKET